MGRLLNLDRQQICRQEYWACTLQPSLLAMQVNKQGGREGIDTVMLVLLLLHSLVDLRDRNGVSGYFDYALSYQWMFLSANILDHFLKTIWCWISPKPFWAERNLLTQVLIIAPVSEEDFWKALKLMEKPWKDPAGTVLGQRRMNQRPFPLKGWGHQYCLCFIAVKIRKA